MVLLPTSRGQVLAHKAKKPDYDIIETMAFP